MKKITKIEVKKKENQKIRVAAYARVSTSQEEQLISLEAQKQHYEKYIKSHPEWEYVGIYYDEGISGTKMEKREGLLQMLNACRQGEIDFIVVKSISRFSRNTVDSIQIVRELCGLGIHMYFEKENIDTGNMESELLLSILSSLAESESHSISENMKWGIRQRFRNGTYKQSCMPYGYENKDGEMVINEKQAIVVRRIFQDILSGMSMEAIAQELNKDGIPSPRSNKWSSGSIRSIVQNERYIGDVLCQKHFMDDQFNRHVNHGEMDQYYIQGHHEAILDEETFNKANEMVERNALEKGIEIGSDKYSKRYALSGKIICGECGGKFKRIKVGEHYCQACQTHLKEKDNCSIKSVREDAIKAAFVTMMNKLIFAREQILVPLDSGLSRYGTEEYYERLDAIESRQDAIVTRRSRVVGFYSKSLISSQAYTAELAIMQAEEKELANEINEIILRIKGQKNNATGLKDILAFTKNHSMLTEFDDELFTRFVRNIIVYKRTEIGFEMKCGPIFRERIVQ